MIGIINYNAGNLQSVCNTLDQMGVKYKVSENPEDFETPEITKIIFPGVGHAKSCMAELKKRKFDIFLKNTQKPVLGICVGMQLLFEFSEEGDTECLGIIKGSVKKFKKSDVSIIPHMGWNEVSAISQKHWLFDGISDYSDFYFVHSYFCFPENRSDILAMTDYEQFSFCCAVQYRNFIGVQFHPEKSSTFGKKILENFIK